MIITVKSTQEDNSDANDFVNFFPDGLILEPNCEIGLLNITYNINQGYAIETNVNNKLSISFPPNNVPQDVILTAGVYTLKELAAEIDTRLKAVLVNMDTLTKNLIPEVTLTCKENGTAGTITIESIWNPSELDYQDSVTGGTNPTGVMTGDIVGGDGGGFYRKTSTVNSNASNYVTTGNWEAYAFGKVNTSATPEYFHICEMVVDEQLQHTILGLTTDRLQDASFSSFGIECNSAGTGQFHIFEIVSGVRQIIQPTGAKTFGAGSRFEIHMPVQDPSAQDSKPLYYHTPKGGTTVLVNLTGATVRGTVDPNADFFPIVSMKEPAVIGEVINGNLVMSNTGLLNTTSINITSGGTGYINGEEIAVIGSNGADAVFYCIASGGVITGVLGWKDNGANYENGDTVVLTGQISGKDTGRANVVDADASVGGSFGTGFVAEDSITAGGMTIVIKDVVAATGVITNFNISAPGIINYTLGTQITFPNANAGGTAAILDFRNVEDYYPTVSGLKFRGLALSPTFHPLIEQQTQVLGGLTLGPLIGIPNTTSNNKDTLSVTGDKVTPNNRTANNLLVHLDNFPIRSRHYLGEGRCVMALPFGDRDNIIGLFQDRSYNLTYHSLHNKQVVNHNEMRIRITDADGNKLLGIHHPVVLNFDLRPKII